MWLGNSECGSGYAPDLLSMNNQTTPSKPLDSKMRFHFLDGVTTVDDEMGKCSNAGVSACKSSQGQPWGPTTFVGDGMVGDNQMWGCWFQFWPKKKYGKVKHIASTAQLQVEQTGSWNPQERPQWRGSLKHLYINEQLGTIIDQKNIKRYQKITYYTPWAVCNIPWDSPRPLMASRESTRGFSTVVREPLWTASTTNTYPSKSTRGDPKDCLKAPHSSIGTSILIKRPPQRQERWESTASDVSAATSVCLEIGCPKLFWWWTLILFPIKTHFFGAIANVP